MSVAVAFLADRYFPSLGLDAPLRTLLIVVVPATVVFLLGLYDDIYTVGPYVKFAVEGVAGRSYLLEVSGFLTCPCCSVPSNSAGPLGFH